MELENVIKLIDAVSNSGLTDFKYEDDTVKLGLKKDKRLAEKVAKSDIYEDITVVEKKPIVSETVSSQAKKEEVASVTDQTVAMDEGNLIKSPLVGTFYVAPEEGAEPFVKKGDSVKKGQVLAIVEAMKLMNDIESDFDGVIAEVLVDNGEMVEYGQPLFRIV